LETQQNALSLHLGPFREFHGRTDIPNKIMFVSFFFSSFEPLLFPTIRKKGERKERTEGKD
tara:strand:- start:2309 stop:2491 length:183 start_codon:yes stop_codon:yes gene_type:complete